MSLQGRKTEALKDHPKAIWHDEIENEKVLEKKEGEELK